MPTHFVHPMYGMYKPTSQTNLDLFWLFSPSVHLKEPRPIPGMSRLYHVTRDRDENQMPVKEKQQLITKDLYTTITAASGDVLYILWRIIQT